jgi:cytoskeleton protein RodZ
LTQQNDPENSGDAIRQQFALLQAEMKRVMEEQSSAESLAPASANPDTAIDFERIERGLEDLRRDADRLHARMVYADDLPGASETIVALRERIEGIAKHTELSVSRLSREMQDNRDAIGAVSLHLETLARRRSSGRFVPLAILLGAIVVGGAVLLSVPGRLQMLIDRVGEMTDPSRPHAQEIAPAPPAPAASASTAPAPVPAPTPVPAPAPAVAVLPPTSPPPSAEPALPAVQPAPPPAPEPVAAVPPPPIPAATPAPPPPAAEPPVAAAVPVPAPVQAPAPAAETPVVAAAPAPAAAPPVAAAVPVSVPAPPPAPTPAEQIVLHAKSDSWVEVRNRLGVSLMGRIMRAGESWTVPDQAGLVLSTGNAGGLELLVDGKPSPSLGAMGVVRRDIPLDPALVREGHYAPASAASSKGSTASR